MSTHAHKRGGGGSMSTHRAEAGNSRGRGESSGPAEGDQVAAEGR